MQGLSHASRVPMAADGIVGARENRREVILHRRLQHRSGLQVLDRILPHAIPYAVTPELIARVPVARVGLQGAAEGGCGGRIAESLQHVPMVDVRNDKERVRFSAETHFVRGALDVTERFEGCRGAPLSVGESSRRIRIQTKAKHMKDRNGRRGKACNG